MKTVINISLAQIACLHPHTTVPRSSSILLLTSWWSHAHWCLGRSRSLASSLSCPQQHSAGRMGTPGTCMDPLPEQSGRACPTLREGCGTWTGAAASRKSGTICSSWKGLGGFEREDRTSQTWVTSTDPAVDQTEYKPGDLTKHRKDSSQLQRNGLQPLNAHQNPSASPL